MGKQRYSLDLSGPAVDFCGDSLFSDKEVSLGYVLNKLIFQSLGKTDHTYDIMRWVMEIRNSDFKSLDLDETDFNLLYKIIKDEYKGGPMVSGPFILLMDKARNSEEKKD